MPYKLSTGSFHAIPYSMSTQFNTKAFVADFWPSSDHLWRWLESYGQADVTKQACYKWVSRESIPADKFALMLALLEIERGAPVSLVKFLK